MFMKNFSKLLLLALVGNGSLLASSAFAVAIQPQLPPGVRPAFDAAPLVKEFRLTGGNMSFLDRQYPTDESLAEMDALNPVLPIETEEFVFERFDCVNPEGIRTPQFEDTTPTKSTSTWPYAAQTPLSISKLDLPGENVVLMNYADLAFEMQTLQFPIAIDNDGKINVKLSDSTKALFKEEGFQPLDFGAFNVGETLYRSINFLTGKNNSDEINGEGIRNAGNRLLDLGDTLEVWDSSYGSGCDYAELLKTTRWGPLEGDVFKLFGPLLPANRITVYKRVK